ncbi:hypothetical protein C8R43DRAFT_1241649 [Mycena crocata]|nr:hypothetical protein C8R43DRAFT_1136822 [Mycena crocata]KAJ7120443.1 hypothetical protein C8R43DRAFT_1241645 [Mycena crocata]KAJ7120447.1 hypothetical protein C8R43DRAFT_1241649 [Mycena crocata]
MQAWPLLDRRRVAPPPKVHFIVGSPANKVLRMHVVLVGRSLAPLVKFPFDFWCSREQSYATQSSTVNNNLLDTISVPAVRSAGPPTSIIYFAFSSPGFKSALNPIPLSREHSRRRVLARHIKFHFSRSCERDDASLRTTFATTSASSRSSAARSAAQQLELHISRSGERGFKFNSASFRKYSGRCTAAPNLKFDFSRSADRGLSPTSTVA